MIMSAGGTLRTKQPFINRQTYKQILMRPGREAFR